MKILLIGILILMISPEVMGQSVWLKTSLTDKYPVACLASSGNDLFVGLSGGGVYKSEDEGMTWREQNNGLGQKYISSITIKGNKIYAASYGEGIYISNNKGESWTITETPPGSKYIYSIYSSGSNLIAATWDGIYYSTDEKRWTKALLKGPRKHNIILSLHESKKALVAGSGQYVFTSIDNGKIWESTNTGSLYDILSFAEYENDLFMSTSGDGIYISSIEGKNWSKKLINKSESELLNVPVIIVDSSKILAGSHSKGVINDGDKMNQGYTNINIKSLVKHKGFYFAGTPNNGLWKYAINGKIQSLEPRVSFELTIDIYPNPGQATTTLKYSINQKTEVTIDLASSDGKIVKHLNFMDQAPGVYQLQLNQFVLGSGIYFIRVRANNQIQTKKLVIIP